jgi:hypothetical protein
MEQEMEYTIEFSGGPHDGLVLKGESAAVKMAMADDVEVGGTFPMPAKDGVQAAIENSCDTQQHKYMIVEHLPEEHQTRVRATYIGAEDIPDCDFDIDDEIDDEIDAEKGLPKPLHPGTAALSRMDGIVSFVVCEVRGMISDGPAECEYRSGLQIINIADVTVPVVRIVLQFAIDGIVRFYWVFVNGLDADVIESLASQPDLPVVFVEPSWVPYSRIAVPNGIRMMAQREQTAISQYADESPWSPRHFAAAQLFVELGHNVEKEWEAWDL